jgi:hypothetical protein
MKDGQLSEQIYDRMKRCFSERAAELTSAGILTANTLASIGEMAKANSIRQQLRLSGVKKTIGLSWTSVNGEIVVRIHVSLNRHHNGSVFRNFVLMTDHIL